MEPTRDTTTVRFPRRMLGYDRLEVDRTLASTSEALRRVEAERDELRASATNLERIGAQVAEMLRALAERAIEMEEEAAAKAARIELDAQRDADEIRAQAAAVLVDATLRAAQIEDEAKQRQAVAKNRRQTAVAALHVAMDQISRLTKSIHELDPEVFDTAAAPPDPEAGEPPVEVEGDASNADPASTVIFLPSLPVGPPAAEDPHDSLATALERLSRWTTSSSGG